MIDRDHCWVPWRKCDPQFLWACPEYGRRWLRAWNTSLENLDSSRKRWVPGQGVLDTGRRLQRWTSKIYLCFIHNEAVKLIYSSYIFSGFINTLEEKFSWILLLSWSTKLNAHRIKISNTNCIDRIIIQGFTYPQNFAKLKKKCYPWILMKAQYCCRNYNHEEDWLPCITCLYPNANKEQFWFILNVIYFIKWVYTCNTFWYRGIF